MQCERRHHMVLFKKTSADLALIYTCYGFWRINSLFDLIELPYRHQEVKVRKVRLSQPHWKEEDAVSVSRTHIFAQVCKSFNYY